MGMMLSGLNMYRPSPAGTTARRKLEAFGRTSTRPSGRVVTSALGRMASALPSPFATTCVSADAVAGGVDVQEPRGHGRGLKPLLLGDDVGLLADRDQLPA